MPARKRIGAVGALGMVTALLFAHSSGPDARYTGAPGDQPAACATSGCHSEHALPNTNGPLNVAGGFVTATFSEGANYTPGKPVTITVTVFDPAKTNQQANGFQMTARLENNKANGQAGSFTPGNGSTVVCSDDRPRPRVGCLTAAPIEFIEQTQPATDAGA